MKTITDSKIVKYVYHYVRLLLYLLPISFVVIYSMIISDFFRKGKLTGKWAFFSTNLIEVPKVVVISDSVDGIVILTSALIIGVCFFFVGFSFLKFIRNLYQNNFLLTENGVLLKQVGKNIIILICIITMADLFRNISPLLKPHGLSLLSELWILIVGLLMVVLHPTFIFGLFFIVIGEVIIKASLIKQENDLTV